MKQTFELTYREIFNKTKNRPQLTYFAIPASHRATFTRNAVYKVTVEPLDETQPATPNAPTEAICETSSKDTNGVTA